VCIKQSVEIPGPTQAIALEKNKLVALSEIVVKLMNRTMSLNIEVKLGM